MFKEIYALIRKELWLEWKQKYAFNGLLMYVISMVVVISLAFVNKNLQHIEALQELRIHHLNVLFWIIILFVAINAVAKSFMGERPGQLLYLYTQARPFSIIVAKMLYNTLLLSIISLITLLIYSFLSDIPIGNLSLFIVTILLGSFAFSSNLTLVSAIAAKAENKTTLLAVLSFPLIVPLLLMLIKCSKHALMGNTFRMAQENLQFVGGMGFILAILSILLFPILWRE